MLEAIMAAIILILIMLMVIIMVRSRKKQQTLQEKNEELSRTIQELKDDLQTKKDNKRDAFRLDLITLPCVMIVTGAEDDETISRWQDKQSDGHVQNISVSGIKVTSDLDLPARKRIQVQVRFVFREEQFVVGGIIVRKEEYLSETPHFVYGIRFYGMDPKERERLQLFIHYTEAERHKYSGKERES